MTESRFQDPDFHEEELVIDVDELVVEIRQEEAARLDEPPYFCYRLANATHDESPDAERWSRYVLTIKRDWSNMEVQRAFGTAVPRFALEQALKAFENKKHGESEPFRPLKKDASGDGIPKYTIGDEVLEPGEDVEVQTFHGHVRGVFSQSSTPWIGTLSFHWSLGQGKFQHAPALLLPPNVMIRKVRKADLNGLAPTRTLMTAPGIPAGSSGAHG